MKYKIICFSTNNFNQSIEIIKKSKENKIFPIIFIKYRLIKGFGIDWVQAFKIQLNTTFSKNSFKLYADSNYDYGLSIELIKLGIDYIKIKSSPIILNKIKQIAKKNKVLLNPKFRIVNLSNIKNISRKILQYK